MSIDAGGQGVQVGTGNVQHNSWSVTSPLFLSTLLGLSAHAAADRIRHLPHLDAVNLFADAPAGALARLADKFRALLLTDVATAAAILADLDPGRAAGLLAPHVKDFPRLARLAEAAEAIAQRAVELTWDSEAGRGQLELADVSQRKTDGYFRRYKQGLIYWSDREGRTHAVHSPIAECYVACGATGGVLGFPRGEQATEGADPNAVVLQVFEGGDIYSSAHGTYSVSEEFLNVAPAWLGFPVAAAEARDGTQSQRFEAGVIKASAAGTFAVRRTVAELTADAWMPVSAETDIDSRATARVQRFKRVSGMQTAVYSDTKGTGVFRVTGRRLAFYDELGGPDSWLGLPVAMAEDLGDRNVQAFEHGSVYSRSGYDVVAVPAETVKLAGNRLGWPVSQELPVGDGNDRIQVFEYGAVMLREGKRRVLVYRA